METENTEPEVDFVDAELDAQDFDDSIEKTFDEDSESAPEVALQAVPAPTFAGVTMSTLPITGEPRVDDALGRLTDLEGLPVHEHVEVFEDVRHRLHDTLSDLGGQ